MSTRRPIHLPARSKYAAKPETVDGIRFHSRKEAKRYGELKLLEKVGEISDLLLQPRFMLSTYLMPGTVGRGGFRNLQIGVYIGDFKYHAKDGSTIVEDVKGFKTPLYRWKKKHVEAQYGIQIREL